MRLFNQLLKHHWRPNMCHAAFCWLYSIVKSVLRLLKWILKFLSEAREEKECYDCSRWRYCREYFLYSVCYHYCFWVYQHAHAYYSQHWKNCMHSKCCYCLCRRTRSGMHNDKNTMANVEPSQSKYRSHARISIHVHEIKSTTNDMEIQIVSSEKEPLIVQTAFENDKTNEKSIESNWSMRGLVGLQNIGNTCFMNCILQCLGNIAQFREQLESVTSDKHESKQTEKDTIKLDDIGKYAQLTMQLSQLYNQMWNSDNASLSLNLNGILQIVGQIDSKFGGYDQQDSHEFLMCVLNGLHCYLNYENEKKHRNIDPIDVSEFDDMMAARLIWKTYKKQNNSFIVDLFQSLKKETTHCQSCKHNIVSFDIYMGLSVPIVQFDTNNNNNNNNNNSKNVTIYDCLDAHLCDRVLDVKSNWRCRNCHEKGTGIKSISLWDSPSLLVIRFERFTNDAYGSKNDSFIEYPIKNLDMSNYCKNASKYDLVGVCIHSGSANNGHYTSYCKHELDKKWYYFDDSRKPCSVSQELVVNTQAYILFYSQQA